MENNEIKGIKNNKPITTKKVKIISHNTNSKQDVEPSKTNNTKLPLQNQLYIIPQEYGQPIMDTPKQSNSIIENQSVSSINVIKISSINPMKIICPYCSHKIITQVEVSLNCCTLFCIIYHILLFPIAILTNCSNSCNSCICCMKCDGKCCYDGCHKCPKCGNIIGRYDSCFDFFCQCKRDD